MNISSESLIKIGKAQIDRYYSPDFNLTKVERLLLANSVISTISIIEIESFLYPLTVYAELTAYLETCELN
jgi:hypothetical protein